MSNIDKLLYIDGLGEITQNLNIGGNLNVANNINLIHNLNVNKINGYSDANNIEIGSYIDITGQFFNAHTITAQNYAVGGTNFISASRQGNFRDVEVKNTNNSDTILLTGDGGHISLEGTLSVDNINEKTGNNGVTIEGVILKDNNLNVSGIGTITTLNSTNITGNLIGNVTGDVTGNATTATTLQAVRTIGGVDFNGSANIDLKGVNIPGDQNTTGSAAKLTNSVNIGDVSFDGSANIDLSVSNGLISSTNNRTIEIAVSTTPTINISDTMTIYNGSGNSILRIESGSGTNDVPQINLKRTGVVRANLQLDSNNRLIINSTQSHKISINDVNIVNISNDNVEIDANLNVYGNLNVTGNINQINSEQINVLDKNIVLASNNNNDNYINDAGLILKSSTDKTFLYNSMSNSWESNINIISDITGNASTSTTLQTPRTIGGVSFDGSANIDLKGVNIPGDQNTTGSAAKLTIPVNIGGVSFDGSNDIDLSGVNSTGNQNTTGSAAKLTNSVNIGGVSFDGSTSIDLPGVNSTGNQNTTGSAAKLTNSVNIGDVSFDGSNDINLSVSNGLTTSTNNRTIDIDISTSPTININTTMTLQNTSGNAVLKIKGSNQPQILFFKDNSEKGYMRYIPTEDILEIRQTNNTTKLRLGNRYSSGTTYDNNGTMVLDIDNIDVYKPIDMNDNQINFQTDNTNHFIKMNNGTGFNGLEYAGGGSGSQVAHYFKSTNGSGTDLMKMYEDNINIGRKVIIQPSANDYTAGDEYMLHIKSFEGQSCRVCIECDFNNNGEDENPSLIFKQDGENIDTILGLANDNEGIVNNNFYIHHTSHLGSISQKNGWERISFATGASGDSEKPIKENVNLRMSIGNTSMNMYNPISMNQNAINFYNDGDTAHQITWNNTDTNTTPTATGMNGLLIRGFGNTVAFCRFQSTADGNTTVMDLLKQKIHMYQPLYMNSTSSLDRPIYLHHNEAFYVRYKNDGNLNGTDLGGFSGVRLSNTNTQSTNKINLQTFGVSPRTLDAKGSVEVYNKLSVIRDGAVLQQDANDTFTVRRVGFCKAIIHSDSGDCEFAFKCGSSNSNQAVIKRKTNDQLLISNDGEYRVEVSNNTCNFVNNNGRLAFQSDRNLVIYNSGGGAIWASNTSSSERRFKDNIVSLDLENSYNIIKQLNPVSFVYIEEPTITKKGFIVDEIEDKIPECLKEITNCDCEDMKSKLLYKEDIVPDLVASVKFLINKVETLETQLLTQSNLISNLQSQLNSN